MGSTRSERHKAFIAVMRALRHKKGWTQAVAAKRLGWTQSKLAQIESAQRQVYYSEIFEIAKGYGIEPLKLLELAMKM